MIEIQETETRLVSRNVSRDPAGSAAVKTAASAANKTEFTMDERKAIIHQVEEIQVAEDLSNKVVANLLGCSAAVWSQIRSGTYAGRTDKYLARALKWIEEREERREAPEVGFVETSIARRILEVCRRAWERPTIGLVVTPSGAGKSAALREFARQRGDDAMLISAGGYFNGKLGILGEIGRRLGLSEEECSGGTIDTLGRRVRKNLAAKYQRGLATPFCIIIDEATTLQLSALDLLRNLHDDPDARPAIVLADTWRLHAALRNPHGIAGGTEQLRSRCGAVYLLRETDEIAKTDVRLVAESVVRGLGHTSRIAAASIDYLHKIANDPAGGRLRNVVSRCQDVYDLADSLGQDAEYSVAQLDYVATLGGGACQLKHSQPPFGMAASAAKAEESAKSA